jgi:hypothetical protein
MFKLFKKKTIPVCPIAEENRQWMEQSFRWLLDTFGKDKVRCVNVLTPHYSDFPIAYSGEERTAVETLQIVANQMEVNVENIHLELLQRRYSCN